MANPRRRRFVAYFNGPLKGSREALIKKTGYTKGRISQLFDESQPFGEMAARNLAHKLGLQDDFFERDATGGEGAYQETLPPVVNELHRRLIVAFDEIPATERAAFVMELEKRANQIRELKKMLIREGFVPASPPTREALLKPITEDEVKGKGRKK